MLDCFDGLAALLTFDSVPGWKLGTMAWSLKQARMDVWTDGWVSLLFWCLFSKRRKWRGGSSSASVCLSPEGVRGSWRVQCRQRTAECSCTLHTHSLCPGNSLGGADIASCNQRCPRWPSGWGQRCRSSIRSLSHLGIADVIGTYGRIYCPDTVIMSMPLYKMINRRASVSLSVMTTFPDLWLHSTHRLFLFICSK